MWCKLKQFLFFLESNCNNGCGRLRLGILLGESFVYTHCLIQNCTTTNENWNIHTLHRRHFYSMDKIRKWTKKIYGRNKSKTSMKFDFKFSKENIEFLGTLMYIDNLHSKSAHLFPQKKVSRIVRHSKLSTYVQLLRYTGNITKT